MRHKGWSSPRFEAIDVLSGLDYKLRSRSTSIFNLIYNGDAYASNEMKLKRPVGDP